MAETRTIRTVLELNAQRYTAGAAAAAASAKSLAGELSKVGDASGAQRANYDRVGNSLLGVGTAAAAGLGLAAKASMDWESAWAGVLKTVDGSDAELAALEEGLRGLTQVLPATHTEIAGVAEAAGQLGVAQGDIVDFTRTMINLGETTNLSAEEAATGLARFSNIMGTSQGDVDRLGAAIVGLGNNYATTEAEILAMSMRLAGTGAQLGLSEGEVLGLATAMSSVGVEAEAGGTAMSMGMRKIEDAVREGGDALTGFAEVAGMSNEEFAKLWSEDSAAGLDAFVQGLSRVSDEGGNVSGVLSDLGIKGIRESDTFLRLAGASDILTSALSDGNTEFERNLALVQEAEQRYKTTESQLQIARNGLVDAGIEIGASVLPVLADVAGGVADLATWFAALPEPVQRSVTGLGAMVGATGLVAGGMVKLVPAAIDTVNAFRDLRTTSPQTASALGKVAGFAGRAAGAFVALQVAGGIADQFREVATTSDEMSAGLLNAHETGQITKGTIDELVSATGTGNASVTDLANALDILDANALEKAGDFLASGLGVWDTQTEVATKQLQELDRAMASLYSSGNTQAVAEVLAESGVAFEDLIEHMPTLETELTTVATAMGLEADAATLAAIATGDLVPVVDEATGAVTGYNTAQDAAEGATDETTGAVEEQVDALTQLHENLETLANLLLGARGAEREFLDSLDDGTEALKEYGKVFTENGEIIDRHSENARKGEAALDGIAASTHAWAGAADEANASAEELDAIMSEGREAFIALAEDMGMSEEAAKALADELKLFPEFVETEVQVNKEQAEADLAHLDGVMTEDRSVEVPVTADTAPAQEDVEIWGSQVGDVPAVVHVAADLYGTEATMEAFYAEMQERDWTVEINGDVVNANEALDILLEEVNEGNGTVTINGMTFPADTSLMALIEAINLSDGTVTIDGDPTKANAATDRAKAKADGTTGEIDVDADTSGANSDINTAARDRTSTIRVKVAYDGSVNGQQYGMGSQYGRANGGWLNEGLNAGGWVPGPYPGKGIDNTWMPVKSGLASGGLAIQPLAGTEFVVNGQSAQQWGPALEAINAGVSQAQLAAMLGAGRSGGGVSVSQQISGLNAYEVARESRAEMQHVLRDAVPTLTR